jgi:hypothetical protein
VNVTADDLTDAARLVGWAARPKERPARHADYTALVRRYLDDADFSVTCDQVATGLGLSLVVDADVGVVAIADADSPLRMPLSDFVKRTTPTGRRALPGLVLLAVAKVAYPHPAHLDDAQRVPRVSVAAVVEYLNRLVERIGEGSPDPDADRPDDGELWRSWHALRQARSHAERTSIAERTGLTKRVCRFLEEHGHLALVSDADGGTWRAAPRFRLAVTSMTEDSVIYGRVLTAAADHEAGTE